MKNHEGKSDTLCKGEILGAVSALTYIAQQDFTAGLEALNGGYHEVMFFRLCILLDCVIVMSYTW